MDSAPRDGRRFLFWNGRHVCMDSYTNGKFFTAHGYPDQGMPEPLWWTPSPIPPQGDAT